MIIPETEGIVVKIIYCPKCKKYYQEISTGSACAVMHSPGTCCHFGDKEISKELVAEIENLINNK